MKCETCVWESELFFYSCPLVSFSVLYCPWWQESGWCVDERRMGKGRRYVCESGLSRCDIGIPAATKRSTRCTHASPRVGKSKSRRFISTGDGPERKPGPSGRMRNSGSSGNNCAIIRLNVNAVPDPPLVPNYPFAWRWRHGDRGPEAEGAGRGARKGDRAEYAGRRGLNCQRDRADCFRRGGLRPR